MTQEENPLSTNESLETERQRLLAARGWELDRERVHVLRSLLAEPLPRIFFYGYAQLRNRDKAVEFTRSTLMFVSRYLAEVPDTQSLDHWIFEYVATECPIRLSLLRSELGPEPAQVLGPHPNDHYLKAYPTTEKYREAHLEYVAAPADTELAHRAGWAQAKKDLHLFLDAHFGEEGVEEPDSRSPLAHRLERKRMSVRSGIQWVIFIAALVYAWILRGENLELKNQIAGLETTIDSVEEQPPMVPEPVEDLTQIPGAEVAFEEDSIFFTWDQVEEATHYQLIFLTAKMDTLFQRTTVRQSEMRVPFDRIEGFELDASYLFRVDALKSGKPVATTGLVSYPPI